jgi:hypothetical protein
MADGSFRIDSDFVHLDVRGGATVLPGFEWSPEYLAIYEERFRSDGGLGRMVCLLSSGENWTTWERHPAGEELAVTISGRFHLIQEGDTGEERVNLTPGTAAVNPTGVWHTLDVVEPGEILFVTPGSGTEHRPRS